MTNLEKDQVLLDGVVFERDTLLAQMDRVIESRHFRNSKRYPLLLRFVVEQAIAGRSDGLKERTLGMDIFARAGDYDTNADPIVRVTAGEVRKRLAQYYHEAGHETEIRIELPVGAYVPHFLRPELPGLADGVPRAVTEEPAREPAEPERASEVLSPALPGPEGAPVRMQRGRWWWALPALGVVLLALAVFFLTRQHWKERATESVWRPALQSDNPITIVIGVHSFDDSGHEREDVHPAGENVAGRRADMLDSMVRSDMVPVSDVVSYSRVTDLLAQHGRHYQTTGSADATIEDVRRGPLVLIGGLDNVWTLRLTSKLRYRFEQKLQTQNGIVDSLHPETVWRFNNMQDASATTRDFALVASYFDTTIDQPVIVIAGVGKTGTEVASEFMTSDVWLKKWLEERRLGRATRNVELVLSTDILDGKAGPPRVVASSVW